MGNNTTLDVKALRNALRDPQGKSFQGKQFNRYDLLSEIARGGMGIVFRAKHRELGSLVALKLLAQADPSPEAIARFRREARVLAKIKHPHVVGISDLGEDKGIAFLAMELIEGGSLQEEIEGLRKKELPPFERAVKITLDIARALEHCHELGAIHRDVKPHNILLEKSTGRAVLTDFGLVKRDPTKAGQSASITAGVSQAGKLLGTPSYMSPEQFEPDGQFGAVGPKSDVWGMGAVLHFTLTGVPPFQAANVVDLYAMVVDKQPPAPSQIRDGVPEALDALVHDCFTKKVDERLSMSELVKRLELLANNPAMLKPKKTSSGLAPALGLLAAIVALAALHLTVIQPEQGKALLDKLSGGGAGVEVPEGGGDVAGQAAAGAEEEVDGAAAVTAAEVAALEVQAKQGDAQAMLRLGVALRKGVDSGKPELAGAYRWFVEAAQAGNVKAMVFAGQFLSQGRGIGKDERKAVQWFRKAAQQDNPTAMFWLGHMYKAGRAGEGDPDMAQARSWFEKAVAAADRSPGHETVGAKAAAELERLAAQ